MGQILHRLAKHNTTGFPSWVSGPRWSSKRCTGICPSGLEDYDGLCIFKSFLKAAQRIGDVLAVAQVFELIAQVLAHERDVTGVRLCYESPYKASIVNPTFRYWRYCKWCLVAAGSIRVLGARWWCDTDSDWQDSNTLAWSPSYIILRWEITRYKSIMNWTRM